jgi:hypothetical protein
VRRRRPTRHLGREINTARDEWAPAPSPDGTVLMFASNRPGGKHDLFVARAHGDGFAPASRRRQRPGDVIPGYTLGPSIDGGNRSILYFSCARPEVSAGKLDVYRVHYALEHGML